MAFHRVAITTGGHPKQESFKHLSDLGHAIEQPIPSLFTFNIADKAFKNLMGTVVEPVYTSIPGTKLKAEGPLLITHWGMSGPAVLKLSSHAARYLHENNYQTRISVNWVHESFFQCLTKEKMAMFRGESTLALIGSPCISFCFRNRQKRLTCWRVSTSSLQ